jgi:hypothetical protein
MVQTVILRGLEQRALACGLIHAAPADAVVRISGPKRTDDQNAKLWAMISDVSRAKPEGRIHTPEVWKCLFMAACGHSVRFEMGLDNRPFPVGFSSSRLTKAEFADLITTVAEYGDRHGVEWSEPHPDQRGAA